MSNEPLLSTLLVPAPDCEISGAFFIPDGVKPSEQIKAEALKRKADHKKNILGKMSENKFEKLLKSASLPYEREKIIFVSAERYFMADFYIAGWRIALEVDGSSHDGREDYDQYRDDKMLSVGIQTVRFRYDSSKTTNFTCYKENLKNKHLLKHKIFTDAKKPGKSKKKKKKNKNDRLKKLAKRQEMRTLLFKSKTAEDIKQKQKSRLSPEEEKRRYEDAIKKVC